VNLTDDEDPMGPKPFPLRVLGVSLRLVLLLGVGPASGAAQVTGGFTTAFTLATEAAARAVPPRAARATW
jgi:hypothetical protein